MLGGLNLREELLPGAFALEDAVIQGQSVVIGSDPMDILTPGDQWAYAVMFPIRSETCRRAGSELLCVTLEAEVKSGRVGVGCLSPDGSTYVSTESDRMPEDGNTVFDVVIERPGGRERKDGGARRRSH